MSLTGFIIFFTSFKASIGHRTGITAVEFAADADVGVCDD